MNTGEPFGLPNGTVRGIIALAFTAGTLYLWVSGQVVPEPLLALNGLVVGNYFGSRGSIGPAAPVSDETVGPPFIPGEEDNA
jgi:hypothetical protein